VLIIQVAGALLLLLGSALIFHALLALDGAPSDSDLRPVVRPHTRRIEPDHDEAPLRRAA
jgi:hypothetical protein